MAWLEITVHTTAASIDDTAAMLTAAGFSELVLEDQNQFEDDREKASPLCRQLRALVTPPNGKCEVTLKLTGSWKLFLLEKGENFFEIFLLHQPLLPKEDVMLILQMRKCSLR